VIYVTFGTAGPFPRLLQRLDELAEETGLEIIIQTGTTPQTAKHCSMLAYLPSQKDYFQRADLVIAHAGVGTQLELLEMHRPFVVVPRRAEYGEHNDNHQIETCEILHRKYGILFFPDLKDLTAEILRDPPAPYPYSGESLRQSRQKIALVLAGDEL